MSKIATVAELFKPLRSCISSYTVGEETYIDIRDAMKLCKKIAKLHVKAALKKATNTVEDYRAWGDTERINNCYPEKLIK